MIAARLVFKAAAGWTFLTLAAAAALVALASGVEAVARGADDVLQGGLRHVPAVLVPLSPVLVLLGAALTAAWMDARGERTALQALGLGPARTGIPVAVIGAFLGVAQLAVADHALHRLAEQKSEWVWLPDGTAIRPIDSLAVHASGGNLTTAATGPSADVLARATEVLEPSTASGDTLAHATARLPRIEWHSRRARIVACTALAFLGWLPLGSTSERQVLAALSVGLGFLSLDIFLEALAGWGHLAVIPGAWAAPILGAIAVLAWSRR